VEVPTLLHRAFPHDLEGCWEEWMKGGR
jgi:hypothetical protein